jgi:hypothetical protein
VNDVDALIGWLLEAPSGRCPVEDCGATAALSVISGAEVTVRMSSRGPRELTAGEQRLLQTLGVTIGHERLGILYADNVPAAAVTAVLLPHRVPDTALGALGTDASGAALGDGEVPLGRALAGLGVWREPLEALPTPGQRDAAGREQAIWSVARLWLGFPIALVTERFYQAFLDAHPGPWTMPSPGPRTTP